MVNLVSFKLASILSMLGLLAACAAPVTQHRDYTAFKNSKPRSVLLLPPINETSDVRATYGVLSQMTEPVAEAGYYVVPVAVMDETFKQNGLTAPADIQDVAPSKLREIFGADAALYSTVKQYGSVYQVLDTKTVVEASAKLVDLRTGDILWEGRGRANGKEVGTDVNISVGLVGALVQAAVKQIAHSLTDKSHDVAKLANERLLHAGPPDGLLYGPRSPKFGTD
jgi:hypothetical protein